MFIRFLKEANLDESKHLFVMGETDANPGHSMLSRRSYIGDILIREESWDMSCKKVERLLDVCDCWNFSISATEIS